MRTAKILLLTSILFLTACTSAPENTVDEQSVPRYGVYTEDRYYAQLGKQQFAIFFYASWDPLSQEIDNGLNSGISTFPDNTVILKANYDKEFGLKRMYNIQDQSTFIILDQNGKLKKTLRGPNSEMLKKEFE